MTDGLPKMGDLLVIFYLFPIPAMAIMLAGSSSGSPYGGIGFSREMIMMLAYEVPLLMIMLTVAMKVGGGSGAEFSLILVRENSDPLPPPNFMAPVSMIISRGTS